MSNRMRVYFIRHGETKYNRRSMHQPVDATLSEEGKRQAQAAAALLKNHHIDAVISSDISRAVETARPIAAALDVPITESELWREIRRPTSLFGHSHWYPKTFDYVLRTIFNRNKKQWHYEDGESLFEVHRRAERAEQALCELSGEHTAIAVVTHAVFLEIFVNFMCKRGKTSAFDYFPIFSPFSTIKNGSVTVIEYFDTEAEHVCSWGLELFNDTSHLKS